MKIKESAILNDFAKLRKVVQSLDCGTVTVQTQFALHHLLDIKILIKWAMILQIIGFLLQKTLIARTYDLIAFKHKNYCKDLYCKFLFIFIAKTYSFIVRKNICQIQLQCLVLEFPSIRSTQSILYQVTHGLRPLGVV